MAKTDAEWLAEGRGATVKQYGTVPVISHVPAFVWRCEHCGWQGNGLLSEKAAVMEAAEHLWKEHSIIPCKEGWYGGPHDWKHVKGTDSISECRRCHWMIGK